jgi:hypothetical protein
MDSVFDHDLPDHAEIETIREEWGQVPDEIIMRVRPGSETVPEGILMTHRNVSDEGVEWAFLNGEGERLTMTAADAEICETMYHHLRFGDQLQAMLNTQV